MNGASLQELGFIDRPMAEEANIFKLFSDSTRVRILALLLCQKELCICQMMGALDMSQPRISQQLAILKTASLVKSRRSGKWVYYTLNEECDNGIAAAMLRLVSNWYKHDETSITDQAALTACLKKQKQTGKCELKSFSGVRKQFEK